jgi:hypothetical protein
MTAVVEHLGSDPVATAPGSDFALAAHVFTFRVFRQSLPHAVSEWAE